MTTAISATAKARIEAQGFVGLDAGTLTGINYWLRLAPAICMAWTAVGTALSSPAIVAALVPFAALGAILPGHPFDLLYTHGFRRLLGGPRLPRYPAPRRFACLMGTAMLSGEALALATGRLLLAHILGWGLVTAALVTVTTGFCIPSFVYGLFAGRPRECAARNA